MSPSRKRSGRSSAAECGEISPSAARRRVEQHQEPDAFVTILAESGCRLTPLSPLLLSRDLQQRLELRLKGNSPTAENFLAGLQSHIADEYNLHRLLMPMAGTGKIVEDRFCDSLARVLLSVASIQTVTANMLLEKLPEHIGEDCGSTGLLPALVDSIPRWLNFLVDSKSLTEKLLELLTICPIGLKKEIITFLPEVIVDAEHEMVMLALQQMLTEDLQLVVPILDAFTNMNLEDDLFEQVVNLAVDSLRTAEAEDLPLVIKFLLQSATSTTVKQIVQQLREHLNFVTVSDVRASRPDHKQKGKSSAPNCEALILEAIRSGLRLQNLTCEAFLKEIRSLEGEQNHKVVDMWLLLIIHGNGAPHRKVAESLLKRKVIHGDIGAALIRQCVQGRGESLQDYFKTLFSVSSLFLRNNEAATHEFGMNVYMLLFEEFVGDFHRQEVLGSLITHIGSGVAQEVGAALDTLLLLVKKHASELLPMSSFLNGILDYLEGFQDTHLHMVYGVFSNLAMAARFHGGVSIGPSVADDLLIIVRKQISNPDLKYKRMGIIGAVGLVSCLGKKPSEGFEVVREDSCIQESSITEVLALLQTNLDACKGSPAARAFFYDELAAQVEASVLHPSIIEWICVQVEEFSALYLGDLEEGELQGAQGDCGLLEGEVWMNLDGNMSPIILNILPMLTSLPNHSDGPSAQALLYLSANIRLLAAVERETNQGSLGGIDALLGCPFYLPKYKVLLGESWKRLSKREKELSCFALYYTINWIRELLNAFSTQIEARLENSCTQLTTEEMTTKLLKRLRNLLYLEQLLNECLKGVPYLSFPQLHSLADTPLCLRPENKMGNTVTPPQKTALKKKPKSLGKKGEARGKGVAKGTAGGSNTQDSSGSGSARQTTLQDAFGRKNGAGASQPLEQGEGAGQSRNAADTSTGLEPSQSAGPSTEGHQDNGLWGGTPLDEQRWKLRALSLACSTILSTPQTSETCTAASAQLPLHLYLLQDLQSKLDICLEQPTRKVAPWMLNPAPKGPSGLGSLLGSDVLKKLQPVFSSLRRHLDSAVTLLRPRELDTERSEEVAACEERWNEESVAAGNPAFPRSSFSFKEISESVLMVTLQSLGKIFTCKELMQPTNLPVLNELLSAFSLAEGVSQLAADLLPRPTSGTLEHAFCGTFAYLDSLHDAGYIHNVMQLRDTNLFREAQQSTGSASLLTATQLVMVLKALVNCARACLDQPTAELRRRSSFQRVADLLPVFRTKLSAAAGRVLSHEWVADEPWKSKGDILQQLLRTLIQCNTSPLDLLEEMACTVLPQVPVKGGKGLECYPALCPSTFVIWYRVQHEEVLSLFDKVMKEVLIHSKVKTSLARNVVVKVLARAHQCVKVHVALVNLTKTHDKSAVHAVAVKCGGKFVDIFLRGMDFFQVKYEAHKDVVIALVKELQKATRIIQALCSEAKGQKRMPVACKVPAVKRSMERFVFCVKALLHGASHGNSFWMGNLKHKDLQGREISSQLCTSEDEEVEDEEQQEQESDTEDNTAAVASDGEVEG